MGMRDYKKKYQAEYQSLDIRPKGKWMDAIEGSNRMRAKQAIHNEIANEWDQYLHDSEMEYELRLEREKHEEEKFTEED